MMTSLHQAGVSLVHDEPFYEEWGCLFPVGIEHHTFDVAIALDSLLAHEPDEHATWLISVDSAETAHAIYPTFMSMIGKSDDKQKMRLCTIIDATLKANPYVHDIRWYRDQPSVFCKREDWRDSPAAD